MFVQKCKILINNTSIHFPMMRFCDPTCGVFPGNLGQFVVTLSGEQGSQFLFNAAEGVFASSLLALMRRHFGVVS